MQIWLWFHCLATRWCWVPTLVITKRAFQPWFFSWINFMNQQDLLLIKRIQISHTGINNDVFFNIFLFLAKYIGCYVDDTQKRALRGVSFFDYKKMTVFRCQDNCAERYVNWNFLSPCTRICTHICMSVTIFLISIVYILRFSVH